MTHASFDLTARVLLCAALALAACGDSSSDADAGGGGAGGGDADSGAPDAGDLMGGGVCEMDMCDFACTGACTAECLGGRCTAECPEGGCTLDADFEAVAAFSCEGGGCTSDCDNASDCSVSCAGGGCVVGCDADSKCLLDCGAGGEPCELSCGAGATGVCLGDNCNLVGCEVCDETTIDESYMPSLDPSDYSATIDNPLLPLVPGTTWVYEAPDEVITVEVLEETKTLGIGVEVVVVHDAVTTPEGVLIEDTFDWFAQDAEGNVWYFGEETAEYVNGVKANTRGSWEAGVDGALPGIIAHATTPEVGTEYKQEYYRCEAEDMGEIVAVDQTVTVPTGTYDGCVQVRDFSPLDPKANEHKYFCPGYGVVLVEDVATGERVEELTEITLP